MTGTNEYMRNYMLARYHRRRAEAIEKLGGECVQCGSTNNLEFDHSDSTDKSFNVGKAFTSMSEIRLWEEIAKCQLLCKKCHSVKTNTVDNAVGHGEGKTGKRNCRCDLCSPLKNAYNRDLRRRRKETSSS